MDSRGSGGSCAAHSGQDAATASKFFRRNDLMASMGLRENRHADVVAEEFLLLPHWRLI